MDKVVSEHSSINFTKLSTDLLGWTGHFIKINIQSKKLIALSNAHTHTHIIIVAWFNPSRQPLTAPGTPPASSLPGQHEEQKDPSPVQRLFCNNKSIVVLSPVSSSKIPNIALCAPLRKLTLSMTHSNQDLCVLAVSPLCYYQGVCTMAVESE